MIDRDFWRGRCVLVTGHMGFKGAWLCSLLARLGARTVGFGKDARDPLLYRELTIENHESREGDIRDGDALKRALAESGAEIVIHLAAQSIVLTSYEQPVETFDTNVMGTVRLLEAARAASHLKAVVVVTSDKVFRNNGENRPFREDDPLGGADPYSASKAAAEIAAGAMARSFFKAPGDPSVVCARAGNVIGGGDWAAHRLLPDAARALASGEPLIVRNPNSTRPWQHVLDPLGGYLALAERVSRGELCGGSGWNFAPAHKDALPVGAVADIFIEAWGADARWERDATESALAPHEVATLSVDASLAQKELGWSVCFPIAEAIRRTADWYRDHAGGAAPADFLIDRDIDAYLKNAAHLREGKTQQ